MMDMCNTIICDENIEVSILIPAYNEEEGLTGTVEELEKKIEGRKFEIIIVNDGSNDATLKVAKGLSEQYENIYIESHKVNCGYGTAIKTALTVARGQYVVWYDADGQHRPEDMLEIIEAMKDNSWDYCIGVRNTESHVERNRILGKKILGVVVNMLAREPMKDFNSGMRAFKRVILLKYINFLPKRFGASTVTSFLMQEVGIYSGGEVEITVRKRVGKSSVRQVRDGLRTIGLILNIILVFRPLQIFSCIGGVFAILGVINGAYVAFRDKLGVPIMASVWFLMGIQIVVLGILSYQISRVRLDICEKRI